MGGREKSRGPKRVRPEYPKADKRNKHIERTPKKI